MYLKQLVISFRALLVFSLLTGIVYPLTVTGISQLIFPDKANGSLLRVDGKIKGSELIGQSFDAPEYFWGRLSATGPTAFNGAASSGSNFGPLNPALLKAAKDRVDALRQADPTNTDLIPIDLVTASASGLDPHITPAAARYQRARVARRRGFQESVVEDLILKNTAGRFLGLIGEPGVNVLKLNLALDEATHVPKT